MKRAVVIGVMAVAGIAASTDAVSTTLTWRASGTIDELVGWQDTLPFVVAQGDPFAFEFAFDTAAPDANPDPTFGQYFPPAPSMLRLQLGANSIDFDLATSLAAMNVLNNFFLPELPFGIERDSFQVGGQQSYADGSFLGAEILLFDDRPFVFDESGDMVVVGEGPMTSDTLPTELLDLNGFTTRRQLFVSQFIPNVSFGGIFGTVTSLVSVPPTSVPEPSMVALFCAGLLALGLRGRLRDRSR